MGLGSLIPTSWSDAASKLLNPLDPNVGPLAVLGPQKPDMTNMVAAQQRANQQADALGAERAAYRDTQAPVQMRAHIDQAQQDEIRRRQLAALGGLDAAANGTAPSVAQAQAQQQADRAAAQQFGMAAALGGRSPGGALRQASMGAAQVQGDVASQGAALRAQEMQQARQQQIAALQGMRGQDIGLATDQASLNNQAMANNLQAQLANQGQNLDWRKALLGGQNQALGTATNAATGQLDAAQRAADSNNRFTGGLLGGLGSLL